MTNGSPDRRRPTLSAVAAVAGTSVPTVSKVLRGGTDVSPEMRLKVMDAVRTVGYTRRGREPGGRFRRDRSTMVAVLDELETRGLIARRRGEDRRTNGLWLTRSGRSFLAGAMRRVQAHARGLLEPLHAQCAAPGRSVAIADHAPAKVQE